MAVLAVLTLITAIFVPFPGGGDRSRRRGQAEKITEGHQSPDLTTTALRVELPPFQLTERNGQEVSKDSLGGKVWIAAFVFTRCTMGCPSVTGTMKQLQTELKLADRDDVRLVTFTVDPERDGLDDLKKYAKSFQAHETRWLFLTGKEEAVRPLLKNGFKVAAERRPPQEARPGDEFNHTTKLAVIDKKGRICGFFDGKPSEGDPGGTQLRNSLDRLKAQVEQLVHE